MSPTTRFPQLTLRGVSATGANGAEGAGSPELLGSQPISVGWVQRRTKLRTQCKHRLDTSTGATRRRSAGNPPGSGASHHLAFSQRVTSVSFAVSNKRYGGSRTQEVQGSQPCRGFGARSPDQGLGREPRRQSMSPTPRSPQLTLRGVSATGANGAEGAGSPALLGSQPITVGWVQRRTKLRTTCKYRLDTSTGATRRRSAGTSAGLRGVAPSGV